MMRTCMGAALGSVVLAVAVAPAADAARPGKLRVASLGSPPSSAEAGDAFRVSTRVTAAKKRRAVVGRLTFSLRRGGTSVVVRGYDVKRLRPGRSRTYRARLTVPRNAVPGVYSLRACVRRIGSGTSCRTATGRLNVPATGGANVPTTPPATPADTRTVPEKLRDGVTNQGMIAHMRELQAIADANGGNRASGLQGYGATTQYVLSTLRAAGYTPVVQNFVFDFFRQTAPSTFARTAPTAATYAEADGVDPDDYILFDYAGSGSVTGATVTPVDLNLTPPQASTSGCEDADFAGFPAGNVALIQRGTCTFGEKVVNATEAGASAVILFNQGNTPERSLLFAGTLGAPAAIPAIAVSYDLGAELAAPGTAVTLETATQNEPRTTNNILAQTAAGDPSRVVMVGAHLDSVPEGPGINDNGSGTAFNLELAVQMARLGIVPANQVRFAFWGAEEEGLIGSTYYVGTLAPEELAKVQMNLNFDMLASPNHAKFVYDGDFSDSAPPLTAPDVNPGAAEIEQAFTAYFATGGIPTEPSAFDGRSDYKPFQDAGIPAGGLFSGAEGVKSAEQAAKWGGTAGLAYDPNYHEAGDTIDNLDPLGFEVMGDAGAWVAGTYATQTLAASSASGRRSARARSSRPVSEYLGSKLQK